MNRADVAKVIAIAQQIRALASHLYLFMLMCGGQSENVLKDGLYKLVEGSVEYVHGPGCPVCVIPEGYVDEAVRLAQMPGVLLAVHGNLLNVPGTKLTLLQAQVQGARVKMVASPDEALELATRTQETEVVYFAIGFETTVPLNARAILAAEELGLTNFSMLAPQVRVPPALELILSDPEVRLDGVIGAGHVCTVMGTREYQPIAASYRIPIVVGGFTPLELMIATYQLVRQCEDGTCRVQNAYPAVVRDEGNRRMQDAMYRVFQEEPRLWRGIRVIRNGGLGFRSEYEQYDAVKRFGLSPEYSGDQYGCIAGEIVTARKQPDECPLFCTECTIARPVGPTMVTPEGICRIYASNRSSL